MDCNEREMIFARLRAAGIVKPCPFCGMRPHWVSDTITCCNFDGCKVTACVQMHGDNKDGEKAVLDTVAIWNRRA